MSWGSGVEGASDDPEIGVRRGRDIRALLATLFASRGTIMLTAGDEFGRTQAGNNNAYAQDNAISWLDWSARDIALEDFVAALAESRAAHPAIGDPAARHDVAWFRLDGEPMTDGDWTAAAGFEMRLPLGDATLTLRLDHVERSARVQIRRPA